MAARNSRESILPSAPAEIIGQSPAFLAHGRDILDVALIPGHVLITGESGSGKEFTARAVHQASGRTGELIAVNGLQLEGDARSLLLGYEGGFYSNASPRGSMGLFEQAHQGTIFIDEIGETSLATQGLLLRFMEDGINRRIGANRDT